MQFRLKGKDMIKKIKLDIDYIEPNSSLIFPIYSEGGEKILSDRVLMTPDVIGGIRSKYGNYVYYEDEVDESAPSADILNTAVEHAARFMSDVRKTNKMSRTLFRETEKVISDLVSDLVSRNIGVLNLMKNQKSYDEYINTHSVNVAVLTAAFSKLEGLSLDQIREMALGGFMVDVGQVMLDRQLSVKEGLYSISDRQKIKRHPQLGYELLKDMSGVSPVVMQSVLFHHERFNSEGYYQMPYENLPMPPKIVGVCDMYDALTTKRPYRDAFSPSAALKILMNSVNRLFDFRLIRSFINSMKPILSDKELYNVDDICELNSRELAVVRKINEDDQLRPEVTVFCRFERKNGKLSVRFYEDFLNIDLKKDGKRFISKLLDDRKQIEIIKRKLSEKK